MLTVQGTNHRGKLEQVADGARFDEKNISWLLIHRFSI
jgi:hypothetical protein